MTTTITISNDQQMNGPISIILPMPIIIIQFPIDLQQTNVQNPLQTNDIKEEKVNINNDIIHMKEEKANINNDIIHMKEEKIDVTTKFVNEGIIDIKEEDLDIEMNEYILHENPNLYDSFSPISTVQSENTETDESFVSEDMETDESFVSEEQDKDFDYLNRCFQEISEIMDYLKGDIRLN